MQNFCFTQMQSGTFKSSSGKSLVKYTIRMNPNIPISSEEFDEDVYNDKQR